MIHFGLVHEDVEQWIVLETSGLIARPKLRWVCKMDWAFQWTISQFLSNPSPKFKLKFYSRDTQNLGPFRPISKTTTFSTSLKKKNKHFVFSLCLRGFDLCSTHVSLSISLVLFFSLSLN